MIEVMQGGKTQEGGVNCEYFCGRINKTRDDDDRLG